MKEYIKLFEGLNSADGYEINDIPFTSTIKQVSGETAINIRCNKQNSSIIIEEGEPRILSEVTITGTWNPSVSDKNTKVIISGNVDLFGKTDCYSIEFEEGGHLTINAGARLRIWQGGIENNDCGIVNYITIIEDFVNSFYGELLLHPNIITNTYPLSDVKFTSRASTQKVDSSNVSHWQRFSIQTNNITSNSYSNNFSDLVNEGKNSLAAGSTFQTRIFQWSYVNNDWERIDNQSGYLEGMSSFKGYMMTNNSTYNAIEPVTYTFGGNLITNHNSNLIFTKIGNNYFGNSYTASIKTSVLFDIISQNNLSLFIWNNVNDEPIEITSNNISDYPYIMGLNTFIIQTLSENQNPIELSYSNLVWNPSFE